MKPCPFCGEEILPVAVKCKHCGEFLDGRKPATPKKRKFPHDVHLILTILTFGVWGPIWLLHWIVVKA